MTARVVKIGKRSWVAGLSWWAHEDIPSKAERIEDAERLNASWEALRISESIVQGGYCAPIPGVKNPSKLYSLAAMLADSRREPWLGTFKIADGLYWYIAVRDRHAILLDGDVIGSEAEILAAREHHSGYTDWNYIDGNLADLEEMLEGIDAKPTKLKSLKGGNYAPVMMGVAAVAAVGILGGGAYWWNAKKQEEEQARLAAIKQFQAQLAANKAPAPVEPAVPALPAPDEWLRACGDVLQPLPLSRHGWEVKQVGCDASSAVVRWEISSGATVADRPEGEVSEQGDSIQQRIALSGVKPRDGEDATDLVEAKLAARAWAQAGGHQLAFTVAAQPPALPGAPAAAPAAAPKQVGVGIEMAASPFQPETVRQLANLPGLRLTQIKTVDAGWHLEGVIYGR